jgi:hypothetical protein
MGPWIVTVHRYWLFAWIGWIDGDVVAHGSAMNERSTKGDAFNNPTRRLQLSEKLAKGLPQMCSSRKLMCLDHSVVRIQSRKPAWGEARC